MRLSNTTGDQDAIIDACEDFGGKALQAAEIAEELDERLTEANNQIEELKGRLRGQ